jgi:hypothetical protein
MSTSDALGPRKAMAAALASKSEQGRNTGSPRRRAIERGLVASFHHLVGAGEDGWRDRQAERLWRFSAETKRGAVISDYAICQNTIWYISAFIATILAHERTSAGEMSLPPL